jgi:hypothetical protein
MCINRYTSQISEKLKSDHSSYCSFMSVFESIPPYCYRICSEIAYPFFRIYVFTLILIFPLVLKILMCVRHEYYGIFVWKLIHASCVGSCLRKHDFDIRKLLSKLSGIYSMIKTYVARISII